MKSRARGAQILPGKSRHHWRTARHARRRAHRLSGRIGERDRRARNVCIGDDRTALVGVYSSTDPPDVTYRYYASTPAYHVDSSSSIGAGSVFVGNVSFSGGFTGNATVVSRSGKTYVVVTLQAPGTSTTVAT